VLLNVAKCAGDLNGEPRGMPPHSAPCCRSSAATSPLTYRSGVRPDYATFHILRVLSSDADTTVLPSGTNLHALTLSPPIVLEISGNTYVMVVYASPPLSGGDTQRFAKCTHLWPSSVFKHSPALGFQSFTVLSRLALASSPSIDHATPTQSLPFS